MKYYDSHTHLNSGDLFPERKKYLDNFKKIGGVSLVNVGADYQFNENALAISKDLSTKNQVYSAIGLHPYEIIRRKNEKKLSKEYIEQEFDICKNLILENKENIVAIGEAGIDIHYEGADDTIEFQQYLFDLHCQLSQKLDLPIVIHSRDGFDETLEVLKKYKNIKIYFHCWGYSPREIEILEAEFKKLRIGFCGNISYPRAQNLRDSLRAIKTAKILIETDAPYLNVQTLRGKQNEPANIKYIYEYISERLKIDLEDLSLIAETNFKNLYSI